MNYCDSAPLALVWLAGDRLLTPDLLNLGSDIILALANLDAGKVTTLLTIQERLPVASQSLARHVPC